MELENLDIDDINDDLDFEIGLAKKFEAKPKTKAKKVDRNYMDPKELHSLLKEHVMLTKMNPNHQMTNKLGLMVIKLVDEFANSAKYRNYYNGWKYEMKSQAYEHICKYAHGYKVHYTDTVDFFVKWLFRDKEYILDEWFTSKNCSYSEFKETLPVKPVKTPNGKDKFKMAKVISASELDKLNVNGVIIYDPSTFKDEFFEKRPELLNEFEVQIQKNAFNYLTQYAYHAFISVIKKENQKRLQQQVLDERIKYNIDGYDEETYNSEDKYTQFDETRMDWANTLIVDF